jgi:cell division septal protein FtsQ
MKKQVKKRTKKKKLKIKYGRIFLVLFIFSLIIYLLFHIFSFSIKNIFISNNYLLSDQEIIDIAGIRDYPSIFSVSNYKMKKNLESNIYIDKVSIYKKNLKEVYIKVEENYPLFYDSNKNVMVLKNKEETSEQKNCPILINYITDTLYDDFLNAMIKIDYNVLNRISEIKYDPNDVDEERFLFTMDDGNYVYLTLMHFEKINDYVDIIKNFENQKGILYLDSGEYFKTFE